MAHYIIFYKYLVLNYALIFCEICYDCFLGKRPEIEMVIIVGLFYWWERVGHNVSNRGICWFGGLLI